jgi:hypothetical protein
MGAAKLELDVEGLRTDRAEGMKITDLAEKYACASSTILARLKDADQGKQGSPRKKRHYRRSQDSGSRAASPVPPAHTNGEARANGHALRSELQAFLDGHWNQLSVAEKARCFVGFLE